MKKIFSIILALFFIGMGFGCALSQNSQTQKGDAMNKKILIAYFSWGGNTKSLAQKIQAKTGGDIFEIQPQTPYPSDYNETAYGIAKEQKEKNIHPPINNKDISSYDIIFVGTPAWWYTMAPPVMTFLEKNNFEGKTIVPFITHGGGGGYTIDKDMAALAKGASVLSPFVVYERGNSQTDKNLDEWLNKINLGE